MLIVSSVRVTRALGATLVLQWLQTLSAQVLEETCTEGTVGEFQECKGTKLVQQATKVSLATNDQSDLSTNKTSRRRRRRRRRRRKVTKVNPWTAEYCLEKDGKGLKDCWAAKPSPSTAACTADSGAAVCRCSEADCQFDEELHMGSLAVCGKKVTYFQNGVFGSEYMQGRMKDIAREWITGTGVEVYCFNMVKTEGWSNPKHIMKWGSDNPEQKDAYYTCYGEYHWKKQEEKCYRKRRYLNEKCWWHSDCQGYQTHKQWDGYDTVCRDGTCRPSALKPVESCECEFSGRLACNSPPCNGNACFPRNGGKAGYCDLTGPRWF